MAIDHSASTVYAQNRFAPRTGEIVGRQLSAKQIALVEKLTIELAQLSARGILATPANGAIITREALDALAEEILQPAAIVASIQAQLNRTDVRANGDNGLVSILLAQVNAKRASVRQIEARADRAPAPAAPEGIVDGEAYRAADGAVYRAYTTQRGILCLKLWDADTKEFSYAGSASRFASAGLVKLTIEESREFGRATGTCIRCMRHLTDDNSVREGIGPICAGKL